MSRNVSRAFGVASLVVASAASIYACDDDEVPVSADAPNPAPAACPKGQAALANGRCPYTLAADVMSYIAKYDVRKECLSGGTGTPDAIPGALPAICSTFYGGKIKYWQKYDAFCAPGINAVGTAFESPRGHAGLTGVWSCDPNPKGGLSVAKLESSTENKHPPNMGWEGPGLKGTFEEVVRPAALGLDLRWFGHPDTVPNAIAAGATTPSRGDGNIWAYLDIPVLCNNGVLVRSCVRLSGSNFPTHYAQVKITADGTTYSDEWKTTADQGNFCQLMSTYTNGDMKGYVEGTTPLKKDDTCAAPPDAAADTSPTSTTPSPCSATCSPTSTCLTTGASDKSACECNDGYVERPGADGTSDVTGSGCTPFVPPDTTMCSTCSQNASCESTASGGVDCECKPGYVDNGKICAPGPDAGTPGTCTCACVDPTTGAATGKASWPAADGPSCNAFAAAAGSPGAPCIAAPSSATGSAVTCTFEPPPPAPPEDGPDAGTELDSGLYEDVHAPPLDAGVYVDAGHDEDVGVPIIDGGGPKDSSVPVADASVEVD